MNTGRWAIRHSVLMNLVALLVVAVGVFAFLDISREIFPVFSMGQISIRTAYPGASPSEVELLVTSEIEEAVADLDGLDEMTSESVEGDSRITIKLRDDAPPVGRMLDDIKAAIDAIEELPEEAEESRIREVESRFPVITASLFGDLDPGVMKDLADHIADDLRALEGVAQVTRSGVPERVIWVDLDEDRLREYGLTPGDIEQALRSSNLNSPGGSLRTQRGEILLRTLGEVASLHELGRIPLRAGLAGLEVRLDRVAHLREGFEDPPPTLGFVSGERALNLTVFKDDLGDAINIADLVKAYCREQRDSLPAGVDLKTHGDLSIYIRNRLRTMISTAVLALGLVLACLYLFLSGRIAFLTALGIPFAFLGAGAVLWMSGKTFNMVAMFSFIIVLGMVVDDAIVLCENVYRHLEAGMPPVQAAIQGTREVAAPVTCTVTTTMAAFLPMTLISGEIGNYLAIIPLVVSLTLAFSLLECLFILPVHIAEVMSLSMARSKLRRAPLAGLLEWIRAHFRAFAEPLLRARYPTLVALLCGTSLLAVYGLRSLPFELFGEIEAKQFFINLEAAPATRIEEMAELMVPAQAIVAALPPTEIESFNTNIGIVFQDLSRFQLGPHRGQIFVDLWEGEGRLRDSETIINDLRDRIEKLPGFRKIQILRPQAGPNVPAIEIGIEGDDYETLCSVSSAVQEHLSSVEGVRDVRDDYEVGKEEIQLRLTPEGQSLGLTVAQLSRQVRDRFLYARASRVHRSREAPEIRVRLQAAQRQSVEDLNRVWVRLPDGSEAPLGKVARLERRRGPARIMRIDQKHTISVLADVDRKKIDLERVIQDLETRFPALRAAFPDVTLRMKGESQELQRSLRDLFVAQVVAIGLIYLLLAALFRSYFQPLVVMAVIPFAGVGVLVGHLVQGESLSMMSLLGLVALAGIVVNDSLVLVSFINEQRRRNGALMEAVLEAASFRVRPILLTSFTTIAGLVPLAFFASGQARFLAPMAISIVWGLVFTTVLTLVVVPCLYLVYDDVVGGLRRLLGIPGCYEAELLSEEEASASSSPPI